MKRRDFLRKGAGAAAAGVAGTAAIPGEASAATVSQVETGVRCYCGCGDQLNQCDCPYADNGRQYIRDKISEGMSRQEIIDDYVNHFSDPANRTQLSTASFAPDRELSYSLRATVAKSGKGLSLWLLPPAGILIGGALVYYFLKRDVSGESTASTTGTVECPECGAEADADSTFCPGCGHDLSGVTSGSGASYCPGCGAEVNSDDQFCRNCGEQI